MIAAAPLLLGILFAEPVPAGEAPESVTNRKIRQMNQMREERRQAEADGEGVYSDYVIPDSSQGMQRGYYYSRGGHAPANAGGNAFGNQDGAAYPSDGGQAFPTVPSNR